MAQKAHVAAITSLAKPIGDLIGVMTFPGDKG
ncbi:hypothetical protein J2X41_004298 [Caulobacter sp. BE254]|nr:hypothetical protein [Caulobacter sp. BE254]